MRISNYFYPLIILLLLSGCGESNNKPVFEEVTFSSGITDSGMTYGAAWGDFNNDGLPDLYTTNHGNPAVFYQNMGNGWFKDITEQYFSEVELQGDKHGAVWADYDNDGDQDLLLLRGGGRGVGVGPNSFYINDAGRFRNQAKALDIDNPYARTRMQLFYDFNQDGRLDVFLGALARGDGKAPASIFNQNSDGSFKKIPTQPFASASVPFCILSLLSSQDKPDLACRVQGLKDRAGQVFSLQNNAFNEQEILPRTHFNDLVSGDFNGDLKMDLFLARKSSDTAVLSAFRGDNELLLDVKISAKNVAQNFGFEFQTAGEIIIALMSAPSKTLLSLDKIHIGASDLHPVKHQFKLNPDIAGIKQPLTFVSGEQLGVYIHYTGDNRWRIDVSGDKQWTAIKSNEPLQITAKIQSTQKITDRVHYPESSKKSFSADRLLMNTGDALNEEGDTRGINKPLTDSVNAVAGDFDNDMDLDLYIVASSSIKNLENKLLLNDGKGNFTAMTGAGGAPGTHMGVGDAVAMADYDQDGFLDLLVMNGGSMGRSYGLAASDGGYQLYHNKGNKNHWLEIDLEGTQSNRDAIGAIVYVTAGGKKQVRLQDGGVHNRVQNFQRLHFGLGQNKSIEIITVYWPSGQVQELNNIKADQVLRIQEPATLPDKS